MITIIGYGLIGFFIANVVWLIVNIYKEYKKDKKSLLRSLIAVPLNLILGTFGFYVGLVLIGLIFGVIFIFI